MTTPAKAFAKEPPVSRAVSLLDVPRLRTHNQKMTVAARAMVERKTVGDLS